MSGRVTIHDPPLPGTPYLDLPMMQKTHFMGWASRRNYFEPSVKDWAEGAFQNWSHFQFLQHCNEAKQIFETDIGELVALFNNGGRALWHVRGHNWHPETEGCDFQTIWRAMTARLSNEDWFRDAQQGVYRE